MRPHQGRSQGALPHSRPTPSDILQAALLPVLHLPVRRLLLQVEDAVAVEVDKDVCRLKRRESPNNNIKLLRNFFSEYVLNYSHTEGALTRV